MNRALQLLSNFFTCFGSSPPNVKVLVTTATVNLAFKARAINSLRKLLTEGNYTILMTVNFGTKGMSISNLAFSW